MNNFKPFTAVVAGLVLVMCLPMASQAGMINGSHWLVKSGDSVYSIARNVFPGDSKQQARLRRELVSSNPQVFKGNPNALNVGARLTLPAFATGKSSATQVAKTPKAIRLPQPRPKQKAAPVRVAQRAVTPDPADSIGKVVIKMGELNAVNRGSVRKLARNSSVLKGDTLKTSNNSHTQIRLKDGALISLRPNTEFRIADFRYNGSEDGTERGLFELIKGGFRTITGAIGHRNKQNYRVNTTVATIGIRGTHYGLVLCTDGSCTSDGTNLADGLYGGVVDGAVVATNDSGEFSFSNDEYFLITSQTSAPTPILKPTLVFDGVDTSDTEVAATDASSSDTVAASGGFTSISSLEIASVPDVDLVDSATGSVVNPPFSNVLDTTALANLGGILATETYTRIDGTLATDNLGNIENGVVTKTNITMTVDFQLGEIESYDVSMFSGAYNGIATSIKFQDLNNSFAIAGTTGTSCGAGCTGEASVAFIGAQAEEAISSYSLTSFDGQASANGASLLQR